MSSDPPLRPPQGRPRYRLRASRLWFWGFAGMSGFMALAAAVTTLVGAWPGPIITAVAAVAFGAMARLFGRVQIAIYGSELWQRIPLRGWMAPLDLNRLTHVGLMTDPTTRRVCLELRTAEAPSADSQPPASRTMARLALEDYSRRRLERLIAPWVLARPTIATDELTRALQLRLEHPHTAGLRMLLTREP